MIPHRIQFVPVLAALLLLPVTAAAAADQLSAAALGWLRFLHIIGAILFMGSLVASALWMAAAKRTRNAAVLAFASRTVNRADAVLATPGILLLLVPGWILAGRWGGVHGASWVELSLGLFVLSGVIWGSLLIRYQRRLVRLAREAVDAKAEVPDTFYAVFGRWFMWGGIATLLPLAALYLMVFRPALW